MAKQQGDSTSFCICVFRCQNWHQDFFGGGLFLKTLSFLPFFLYQVFPLLHSHWYVYKTNLHTSLRWGVELFREWDQYVDFNHYQYVANRLRKKQSLLRRILTSPDLRQLWNTTITYEIRQNTQDWEKVVSLQDLYFSTWFFQDKFAFAIGRRSNVVLFEFYFSRITGRTICNLISYSKLAIQSLHRLFWRKIA